MHAQIYLFATIYVQNKLKISQTFSKSKFFLKLFNNEYKMQNATNAFRFIKIVSIYHKSIQKI